MPRLFPLRVSHRYNSKASNSCYIIPNNNGRDIYSSVDFHQRGFIKTLCFRYVEGIHSNVFAQFGHEVFARADVTGGGDHGVGRGGYAGEGYGNI